LSDRRGCVKARLTARAAIRYGVPMRIPTALALALALLLPAVLDARPLRKPKRGFQMKMGAFTVQPGEDLEVCQYRRLPNREPIDVSGFEVRMPKGAHHFVIWGYSGSRRDDSEFPAEPVESVGCSGIVPDDVFPQVVIPIQTPNSRFQLPEGLALRLEPRKQVWLNPHMKNFDGKPIKPKIRFNFHRAKKGTVQHHVEGMIVGNIGDIRIPAGGTQTLTAEWTAPVDLNLVNLSTHQHQLGTYGNIEIVPADGGAPEMVYENHDWEHPAQLWRYPPIRLARGQKMRITCAWTNPGDREVRFGPETTDEMCFILGFYYRDPGDTAPVVGGGCVPSTGGLLCPLARAVEG
jgi:hypothetical protein